MKRFHKLTVFLFTIGCIIIFSPSSGTCYTLEDIANWYIVTADANEAVFFTLNYSNGAPMFIKTQNLSGGSAVTILYPLQYGPSNYITCSNGTYNHYTTSNSHVYTCINSSQAAEMSWRHSPWN